MPVPSRRRKALSSVLVGAFLATNLVILTASAARAESGVTWLASAADGSTAYPVGASDVPAISSDGRYVAFVSSARLVEADTNDFDDVYRRDVHTNVTELVSVAAAPAIGAGNGHSSPGGGTYNLAISGDGSRVAFVSLASNLVSEDTNETGDLFVRDLSAGTTTRVSVTALGAEVGSSAVATTANVPALSRDGQWVAFYSLYGLIDGRSGGTYVRAVDGGSEAITFVSKASDGTSGNSAQLGGATAVNADGRYVVFNSGADNLVSGDTNGQFDVFIHDRDADGNGIFDEAGAILTELVSVTTGEPATANSFSGVRAVSDDGSKVVFLSSAAQFVTGDTNGAMDVFLRDRTLGRTSRISVSRSGAELTGFSNGGSISSDGRWIAYYTSGSPIEGITGTHAYVTDSADPGAVQILDVSTNGTVADLSTLQTEISHDGTAAAFRSSATNLIDGTADTQGFTDVFVRLRDLTSITATLTAVPAEGEESVTVPAGVRDVDVATLPLDGLIPFLSGPEAAPLNKMPLNKMPLNKMPLNKMPLNKMPLNKMPLNKMPLNKMPIDGGWPAVLAGTSLEHLPLLTLTLQDIYDLDGGATLGALQLGQVALGQALPNVGLSSIALGSTPLNKMPLDGLVEGGWCGFLASVGYGCPQDPTSYLSSTALIELDIKGVPLNKMPLNLVPLNKMDVASSPIGEVPLDKMAVGSTPLNKMPLSDIALAASPLGPVTLHTISTDVSVLDAIFDCDKVACDSAQTTIADAEAAGAVRASAALGDLAPAFGDLTVGSLLPYFSDDVVFGILILSLLDLADYPWEALDLEALGVRDGTAVTYELQIVVTGSGTGSPAQATVAMPSGFRYVADSATLSTSDCGFTAARACFPTVTDLSPSDVSGSDVTFDLGRLNAMSSYTVALQAHPGLTLGTFTSSAVVESGSQTVDVEPTAPVTVTENWEDAGHGGPNDTPADAPIVEAGHVHVGHIASPDDLDYLRIPAPPAGTRISVRMSNLASDNDLVMFRPVSETPPSDVAQSTVPLDNAPIRDTGITGPQSAQLLDDVPLPEVGAGPAAVSANRADTAEEVEALATTSDAGSHYTIQVSGYNGAASDDWYQMYVKYVPIFDPPSCARTLPHDQGAATALPVRWYDATTGTIVEGTSLPPGTDTVFTVNQQRLRGTHGTGGHQTVMSALDAFLTSAGTSADNPITAAVVSVDAFVAVGTAAAEWDAQACVPEAANVYAAAVNAALRGLRTPAASFDHLVMVGGDDVIPMGRLVDDTTEANEDTYADVFTSASPLQAAFLTRHILSDDPYADLNPIAWMDRSLYVPDFAVGRLVESPSDIAGQLQLFLTSGGLLDPQTALTTGYDFLADGALLIDQNLGGRIGPNGRTTLISETWTRDDVRQALLPTTGPAPDVASVNAHYDHYRSLPALGNATHDESDLFTIADIPTDTAPLLGRILFSMGCHGGLSVPDLYVEAGGPAADWAQTFGDQGAIWVANTGYGYGDDAALALSEQLMADFAAYLDGTVSAGEALVFAKQLYFGRLGAYGAYDEKVLQQPVFYGMPMYRIGTPSSGTLSTTTTSAQPTATGVADLSVASQGFAFDSTTLQRTTTDRGSVYHVNGETQVTHFRPIQPRTGADVTVAGQQARGALITGLTSTDEGVNPVFATPTTDLAATSPEAVAEVDVFPTHVLNLSTYEAPDGTRQRLVVMPGQYFADGDGNPDTGIQRLYQQVETDVYYNADTTAEHVEPEFRSANATIASTSGGNTATFTVDVVDRTTRGETTPAGTVHRVLVMFKDAAGWHDLELVKDTVDPAAWNATVPVAGDRVEFLAQAVDLAGNVGVTTNKGRLFDTVLLPAGQTEPGPEPQVALSGTQGQAGWYHGGVAVTVAPSEGVSYTTTVNGSPGTTVSGEGVHLVEVRGSDGSFHRRAVAIDTAPPTVTIDVPASVRVGEAARAVVTCDDTASGVAACDGPTILDTSTAGTYEVRAVARDHSGRTAHATATYEVRAGDGVLTVSDLTTGSNPVPADTGTTLVSVAVTEGRAALDRVELLVDGQSAGAMTLGSGGHHEREVGPLAAGVYALQAIAYDVDGNSARSEELFLAVYDPSAGFVTGGGSIDSPSGAYAADPSLTGRANFGFVSKYAKGAQKPSGKTQFQFQVADFAFHSDVYDWLVVSGARAQYKGQGSVNGVAGYGFLLTALDADLTNDTTDVDSFRIKIWELESGAIVYDNRQGASEDIKESQAIRGGSIVIHAKK